MDESIARLVLKYIGRRGFISPSIEVSPAGVFIFTGLVKSADPEWWKWQVSDRVTVGEMVAYVEAQPLDADDLLKRDTIN